MKLSTLIKLAVLIGVVGILVNIVTNFKNVEKRTNQYKEIKK